VKYTCSIAFGQIDQLTELAKTAEEVGFDSIALPDSIFYFEKQSVDYPYTADGKRMFDEESPWVDPLILAGAMGAVTSKLRFYTNVMKLGSTRSRCRIRSSISRSSPSTTLTPPTASGCSTRSRPGSTH
jgi:hypothetical protein